MILLQRKCSIVAKVFSQLINGVNWRAHGRMDVYTRELTHRHSTRFSHHSLLKEFRHLIEVAIHIWKRGLCLGMHLLTGTPRKYKEKTRREIGNQSTESISILCTDDDKIC